MAAVATTLQRHLHVHSYVDEFAQINADERPKN